jgi:hypothetical protein
VSEKTLEPSDMNHQYAFINQSKVTIELKKVGFGDKRSFELSDRF